MNPFLPYDKPRFAIVDYRANKDIFNCLNDMSIDIIKTIECKELQMPVCGHPDMVLHPIDYNTIIVAPNVFDYYCKIFDKKGIKVIKGEKALNRNYPEDIAYNVARVGNYAFHNTKYTDPKLKFYLERIGIEFINVNQGYTKCSTAIVSNNAILTSDISIHEIAIKKGINSIFIKPYDIELKGYDYGFIGGAIGAITNKIFLLTGNISDDNDFETINKFVKNNGFAIVRASEKNIADLGTIIPLM